MGIGRKMGVLFKATKGIIKYFVRFHPNGGSGSMPDQLFKGFKMQALTKNVFARTGYLFQGWHRTASSATAEFSDQQQVGKLSKKNKAVITLYAIWKAITYTIRYNGNGATSGSMADTSHTYDVTASLRTNAFSRTGYLFQGWATNAGGGVSYGNGATIKNLGAVQNAIINLYAVWKGITYYVRYNANGMSGSMADSTHIYGTPSQLRANAFGGGTFVGWGTSSGQIPYTPTYANAQTINNLTTANGAIINLYALWYKFSFFNLGLVVPLKIYHTSGDIQPTVSWDSGYLLMKSISAYGGSNVRIRNTNGISLKNYSTLYVEVESKSSTTTRDNGFVVGINPIGYPDNTNSEAPRLYENYEPSLPRQVLTIDLVRTHSWGDYQYICFWNYGNRYNDRETKIYRVWLK